VQSDNTDRGDAAVPQHHETVIDLEPSKTFMHHAVSMVDPETKPSGPRQEGSLPTGVLPGFFGFHVEMQEQPVSEFDRQSVVLPLQQFADELLQGYWLHIHTIYPVLH